MKTTPMSDAAAVKASRRMLLPAGMHDAEIREASEQRSKRGNDMIGLVVVVRDADGIERELHDYLTDTALGAAKLRHACEAIPGNLALAKYETSLLTADVFPGHAVRVKIGIEKKRGYPDRNVIEDYAAASTRVVALREVG